MLWVCDLCPVTAQVAGGVEEGHGWQPKGVHGERGGEGQEHRGMDLACPCGRGGQPPR